MRSIGLRGMMARPRLMWEGQWYSVRATCPRLYVQSLTHVPPPICFLQRHPCRLCSQRAYRPSMLPLLSSPLPYVFLPACFERYVTSPRPVWRLPVALRPYVSNDLLSVQARRPVTRFSLRLSTRVGRPV